MLERRHAYLLLSLTVPIWWAGFVIQLFLWERNALSISPFMCAAVCGAGIVLWDWAKHGAFKWLAKALWPVEGDWPKMERIKWAAGIWGALGAGVIWGLLALIWELLTGTYAPESAPHGAGLSEDTIRQLWGFAAGVGVALVPRSYAGAYQAGKDSVYNQERVQEVFRVGK